MKVEEQILKLLDSCMKTDDLNDFLTKFSKIIDLFDNLTNSENAYKLEETVETKLKESKIINQIVDQLFKKMDSITFDMTQEEVDILLDKLELDIKNLSSISEYIHDKLEERFIKESPEKGLFISFIYPADIKNYIENNSLTFQDRKNAVLAVLTMGFNHYREDIHDNYFLDMINYFTETEKEELYRNINIILFNKINKESFLKLLFEGTLLKLPEEIDITDEQIIEKIKEYNCSENDFFNIAISLDNYKIDFFGGELLLFFSEHYHKFYDFLKRKNIEKSDIDMLTEIHGDGINFLKNVATLGDFNLAISKLKEAGKSDDDINYLLSALYYNPFVDSTDYLNWCIDNGKYDKLASFNETAYDSKSTESLLKKAIDTPEFQQMASSKYDSKYFSFCSFIVFRNSPVFLEFSLNNNFFGWVEYFNESAFTDSNIDKFTKVLLENDNAYVNIDWKNICLINSSKFLVNCLDNKKYYWILNIPFNISAFSQDNIYTIIELIKNKTMNSVPAALWNVPQFLDYYISIKRYLEINKFSKEAFMDEQVKKICTPEVFNEIIKYEFPRGLESNSKFLDYCLSNRKYDLVSKFTAEAFDSKNLESVLDVAVFNEISKFEFPKGLSKNKEFLSSCIKTKLDWVNSFESEAFDINNIKNIIDNNGMKFFLELHRNEIIKKANELYNLGQLELNKYDATIINEIAQCINQKINESTINIIIKKLIEFYGNITVDKIKEICKITMEICHSNSEEIQRLVDVLVASLIEKEEPSKELKKIEEIFLKKDLPYVSKIFLVFQQLHSEQDLKEDMEIYYDRISPVLKNSNNSKIWSNHYAIIWSDLLKCALGSNNRSLKEFINQIDCGNQLYLLYSFDKIKFDDFTSEQKQILETFVFQINILYNMSKKGKDSPNRLSGNILEDLNKLVDLIEPIERGKLADKIIRMYGIFEGVNSLEAAKEYIELLSKKSDLRHRALVENGFKLEPGDFIKGITSISYLGPTLQNGAVAQEFLGYAAGRDTTPLDTDLARFTKDFGNFRDNIRGSMANSYVYDQGFWIILKNDEKFQFSRLSLDDVDYEKYELMELVGKNNAGITYSMGEVKDSKFMKNKIEAFYTSGSTNNSTHYGIRTGFASSEIDFIISQSYKRKNYDSRIGLEIAINGFYIPVVDMDGDLVFSPADYNKLRAKMQGLSYYELIEYNFSSNLVNYQTSAIVDELGSLKNDTLEKNIKVNNYFKEVFEEMGYKFKIGFDGDITPGGVELINTGSTSRFTNTDSKGDYDFILRIDQSIISNTEKLNDFKTLLLQKLQYTKNTGADQPRLKEVKIPGIDVPVDIDLTIVGKTNKLSYSTERSLEDRLATIYSQDREKYQYVLANIILAKRLLKAAKCYKPYWSGDDIPQEEKCGLGGVGIENWILQNGGSLEQAAQSFIDEAKGKSFEDFCDEYYVWDFGENHKAVRNGTYTHDNFVDNMTKEGFAKMKKVLQEYLNSIRCEVISFENLDELEMKI